MAWTMNTVDFISQAARNDPAWVFHHVMDAGDRETFDKWLVTNNKPEAYQAGTTESRFLQIVSRWHDPA